MPNVRATVGAADRRGRLCLFFRARVHATCREALEPLSMMPLRLGSTKTIGLSFYDVI